MPDSIRKRIKAVIKERVEAIDGIHGVQLWDARGNRVTNLDAVIMTGLPEGDGREIKEEDSQAIGRTTNTLILTISLYLFQEPIDEAEPVTADTTDELIDDWLAKLEQGVITDDHHLTETPASGDDQPLALDVRAAGSDWGYAATNQPGIVAQLYIEVMYRTPRTDPYTVGF